MIPFRSISRDLLVRPAATVACLGIVGALVLGACGSDDSSDEQSSTVAVETVTVGSSQTVESQLIAEIYAEVLENAGLRVARKDPSVDRAAYYAALEANTVQLVPDYSNALLTFVVGQKDSAEAPTALTAADQVAAIKTALPTTLTVGDPSAADAGQVIACSPKAVEEHSLKTFGDLGKASKELTFGAPAEFEDSTPFGLAALEETYDATFETFVAVEADAVGGKISSGEIDCGVMTATMSDIVVEGVVLLEDDKAIVPADAVLPLLTAAAATPSVLGALGPVTAGLTTDILRALVVKVEVGGQESDVVAKEFVSSLSAGQG